jgi:hypothetical protein
MPKIMSKKQADRWEKTRTRGRSAFILMYGVLFWGVVTAFLFAAISLLISDRSFLETLKFALPTFMIGGVFWGIMMWVMSERSYRTYQANQDTPS